MSKLLCWVDTPRITPHQFESHPAIGEVNLSKITFNPKSRYDIPKILKGLQYGYTHAGLCSAIFEVLQNKVAPQVTKDNGRQGMHVRCEVT